ncbi:probable 2-oxoglutarate-dependent dioxygenase AOP1 [Juglans regia]|uniref:Probable 2-oxoglutarate-dependent dioxygenase AOP1 n=1 Tax=Juglans regia TaxID=51240 RepID=A0A6P9EJ58_JUGRE|nr:probable 2-oxoglutarate-dependent dioxygenase AOP1 [Juglans regia]
MFAVHSRSTYGCFVAELGNKFPLELHNTMFAAAEELFDFPTETKMKLTSEQVFHGYVANPPVRESMMLNNATSSPEETQKLRNVFWPNGNDIVREGANSYAKKLAELDKIVTRMVFESYGLEKNFDAHLELTTRTLSLIKCREHHETETNEGIKSHTDKQYLTTILHQNRVRGLEIKTHDGEWIGIKVWSNDRIQASVHRVMLVENERYLVGMFAFHDGTIHVPEELVDEEHPLKYKPFNNREYAKAQATLFQQEISVKAFCGITT